MGTNYYAVRYLEACPHCGRSDKSEELHIGKSSAGWCFSLHAIPDEGLDSLAAWKEFLSQPGVNIRNEYGDSVSLPELLSCITERTWPHPAEKSPGWYSDNYAVPGPNNLARHRIGAYCVGHGEGTWDLIPGEFS